MSKKVKILLAIGLVLVLLVTGFAVPVMADDPTPPVTSHEGFLDKVARILGISKDTLLDAFREAKGELRDETFTKILDKAVAKGLITQQEADDVKTWFAQRPPVVDRLLNFRLLARVKGRRFNETIKGNLTKRLGNPQNILSYGNTN